MPDDNSSASGPVDDIVVSPLTGSPIAPSNPNRLIDMLFQRLLLLLCLGVAGYSFVLFLIRFLQSWVQPLHPILLITPICSALILISVGVLTKQRVPDQASLDRAVSLVVVLLGVNLTIGSLWVKDPTRLFHFAPLLAVFGTFLRSRRLFYINLAALTATLALAWSWSPFPPESAGMALSIFVGAGILGVLAHLMMVALVQRVNRLLSRLMNARASIRSLESLIPICAHCKKMRNDLGYWEQVESYISSRTRTSFSHGICPECVKKLYPEYQKKVDEELRKMKEDNNDKQR